MLNLPVMTLEQLNAGLYRRAKEIENRKGELANQYYGPKSQADINLINQGEIPHYQALNELIRQGQIPHYLAQSRLIDQGNIPELQSLARLHNTENEYAPIKYLIEANKTSNSSSRFGKAYEFSRMLSALPAIDRQQWIANNRETYNEMLETLGNKSLENNTSEPQQYLNDAIRKKFGNGGNNPLSTPNQPAQNTSQHNYPTNMPSLNAQDVSHIDDVLKRSYSGLPGQINPSDFTKLSAALGAKQEQPYTAATQRVSDFNQQMKSPPQQGVPQYLGEANQQLQAAEQPAQTKPPFHSTKEETDNQKNIALFEVNRKAAGKAITDRAIGSVGMDKWLQEIRPEASKRLKNAAQYAGLKGKSTKFAQEWQNKNPDALADYDWVENQFKPNLVNQIKVMEKLGSTNAQRKELSDMVDRIGDIKTNPERALKGINRGIKTFFDLSESVIQAAEPHNKGIIRKVYDLKPMEGDYTDYKEDKQATQNEEKSINGVKYEKINGKWYRL